MFWEFLLLNYCDLSIKPPNSPAIQVEMEYLLTTCFHSEPAALASPMNQVLPEYNLTKNSDDKIALKTR